MPAPKAKPAGASPGKAKPDKASRTRATILEAAIARFGRDGFRATSVADIARDAEVSGSLAYAYFDNKEALFLAALDEDSARLISEAVAQLLAWPSGDTSWMDLVLPRLVDALDNRPLARRALAGLEPQVTSRMLTMPALSELTKTIAQRVKENQLDGLMASSIDPDQYAQGLLTIWTSLLMVAVQFGSDGLDDLTDGVAAVFNAARR